MKKVKILLTVLVFAGMMPRTVLANEFSEPKHLQQVQSEQEEILNTQSEVNSRMGLPQTSIKSGSTVSFLDSNGTMFYVSGGTTVTFHVNTSTSASVQMGYINNAGSKTRTYSGTGKSHSTTFKIANTGYYRFYLTNLSSGTITVTSGTISF